MAPAPSGANRSLNLCAYDGNMGFDEHIRLFSEADYKSCLQLTRLTWLEWLPECEAGITRYVTILPNADAARAAARVLSHLLPRKGGASLPSFEARLHLVETTGPVAVPAGIKPGLVHAAIKEAIGAAFLSTAMARKPPSPN
jgi:hypothetical protein